MTIGRLSSRFAAALLVASIIALAVALLRPGDTVVPPHLLTAAQARSVTTWLRGLKLPAASTRVPSDTPCADPVTECVIARSSDRLLAAGLRTSFGVLGGLPGPITCEGRSPQTCSFLAYDGEASIDVATQSLTGYRGGSSVGSIGIENVASTPPPAAPLPAPTRLAAIPRALRVQLRCTQRVRGGCTRYEGSVAQRGDAADLARSWQAMLEQTGWVSPPHRCSTGGRCRVLAARSLKSGGRRFILVTGHLNDGVGGEVRGDLSIAAIG
jgi:hypothetical protein